MERLTGLAPDDAVERWLLWVWITSIWKTLFRSAKNANQSNNVTHDVTRAFYVNKKTGHFVTISGQFWGTKQTLCMGSTPEEGFSFFFFFSSVPNLGNRRRSQNNGFCGDMAGFLLKHTVNLWLGEPPWACYGGSLCTSVQVLQP